MLRTSFLMIIDHLCLFVVRISNFNQIPRLRYASLGMTIRASILHQVLRIKHRSANRIEDCRASLGMTGWGKGKAIDYTYGINLRFSIPILMAQVAYFFELLPNDVAYCVFEVLKFGLRGTVYRDATEPDALLFCFS